MDPKKAPSPEEIAFYTSIKNKIKKFSIPATTKEAVSKIKISEKFVYTTYNTGEKELVSVDVERFLCSISPHYFIYNYAYIDLPGTGVIPFRLYYFQGAILKEVTDFRKMVFLKTRQCLIKDNFVMTNRGYISIKDVKIGDKIETIVNDDIVFVDVKDSFYMGKRKICHILTNSGLTIDCTLDHKISTKRGWIEAKNLTLKDEIVSMVNKGRFGNFKLNNNKLAAFIGYYMADGRHSAPSFTNTNIDYINEMLEVGKLFENCDPYIYERKKNNKTRKQGYDVRFVSRSKNPKLYRPVRNFINEFGLDILSKNRCLTNELMDLNEKQMSILLNRLYAGDGWITYKKDKRRPNYIQYEIGFGSPCYKLIKQIEYILQTKYSIHCYIMECFDKRNKNEKRFWKLRISQKKSVIGFINKIGIKGKTDREDIINLISKEVPYNTNQSFEKIRKIVRREGMFDVYDITTESSDFLTNGLLVHNCGISSLFSLYCLWRCLFKPSEYIDVVSTKLTKAQNFVAKMNPTLESLPSFLATPITGKSLQRIRWSNHSQIVSEPASERAGRGDALSLLILDEAAFYLSDRLTRGIIAASQPTLARTGGSLILISTPNGTSGSGSYYYEQVSDLQISGNSETEKLIEIDWWEVPDIEGIEPYKGFNEVVQKFIKADYYNNTKVRKQAKKFFEPIAENWKTNPWLKKQYSDLKEVTYKQEVLHSFVISGNQVFADETFEQIKSSIVEPIEMDHIGKTGFKGFWMWKKPIPKKRYIMGVDVATGTGKDSSTLEVLDVENYEQVAEFKGFISTPAFGRAVKKVARYYNEAFVVIECNSVGEAIFNAVYYDENDPYNNVYKIKKTKNNITRMTGWETTGKSRPLLTSNLIDWLTVDELWSELKIYSSRIYNETVTWIWNNNKPVHADGAHDDSLIALALALYLRDKAVNSSESFLINEEGSILEYEEKDEDSEKKDNEFDYFTSDFDHEDEIKKSFGMDLEHYKWLVGE